jgi:tRNA threonylcarbamoyl adenosine modification protein YjeE
MNQAASDRAGIFLEDDAATTAFGRWMAVALQPGDAVFLSGGIGAGKTHFARAVIRARIPQVTDVPSPTFTLVQGYDGDGVTILHADLYRLGHPDEATELGLDEAGATAISLIEWPERLGHGARGDALHLFFAVDGDGRRVSAHGPARLLARVAAFRGGREDG